MTILHNKTTPRCFYSTKIVYVINYIDVAHTFLSLSLQIKNRVGV